MKICLVNSFYPPYIGGAETYVASLAHALARRGHEVTVYCSDRPLKAGESFVDRVKVIRMRTPFTFYGTPMVVFPPSFFSRDYDVIHANFPSPYLAAFAAFVSKVRDIPSVLTWHNDLPPVTSFAGVLVSMHDKIAPSYLNVYDRIIATTGVYAKRSEILRRSAEKVTVIRNGVDTKRFNTFVSGDRVREMHHLTGKKVVLFVGALTTWHAYKGVDVLLNAFSLVVKKSADSSLLVVGGGNMLGYYKKMALDLGVSDRVMFAGRVDDDSLPEYYAACDLCVLPSKDSSEGFGLVLVEAMACGKAVIGSRVGGIVDVIKDRENGLIVPPGDVGALSSAMLSLLEDDGLRSTMGNAGRSFAESNDWDRVAERVETVYHEIL
ncbi:MAG: glycosyltransferase family 4 protein [Nitrososphaerota archaeon]|nr:glycosyltransferase family 4 protein [Nitrososphaerota archaeon]